MKKQLKQIINSLNKGEIYNISKDINELKAKLGNLSWYQRAEKAKIRMDIAKLAGKLREIVADSQK